MLDLIDSTIGKHHQQYRKGCMLRRIRHCQEVMVQTEGAELAKRVSFDGGLQTLVHISRYGKDFLEEGRLENDPIFRERQRRMTDKFAVIVAFHEDRFESWRTELRHKQDELNEDIAETTQQYLPVLSYIFEDNTNYNRIERLQAEIAIISSNSQQEYKLEKETERGGGGNGHGVNEVAKGLGKVGKYAIRR